MASPPVASLLGFFLRDLAIAWRARATYPPGHPSALAGLARANGSLEALLSAAGPLELAATRNGLLQGEERIETWVAYANKGVSDVNPEARTWTNYDLTRGLPSNTVKSITRADDHETKKSAIWAATQGGLAKLVDGNTTWQSYNASGGLPASRGQCVYNDGDNLWVGFYDAGAVRIK